MAFLDEAEPIINLEIAAYWKCSGEMRAIIASDKMSSPDTRVEAVVALSDLATEFRTIAEKTKCGKLRQMCNAAVNQIGVLFAEQHLLLA